MRGGLAGGRGRGPKIKLLLLGVLIASAYIIVSIVYRPLGLAPSEGPGLASIFEPDLISIDHSEIEQDCHSCHMPGKGPTAIRCLDCHKDVGHKTMHENIKTDCWSCHAEHIGDKYIHVEMEDNQCLSCHKNVQSREIPSRFKTLNSPMSRQVFSHESHDDYRCSKCHSVREPTIEDVKTENIFTMEACFACHENNDCQACHLFHETKAGSDDKIRDFP